MVRKYSGQQKQNKNMGLADISKEEARKTGKLPWDVPLFLKLSKVQSMQCIVKLQ